MDPEEYETIARLEDDHWWYRGMRGIALAVLDRQARPQPATWRVLDAGCGPGGTLPQLRAYGIVYGLDIAPEAIRLARRRGDFPLVRGSVSDLPYADASFDLVTSFEVIYHLAVRDDRRALAEFARVLRPGGWLLLRVPAYNALRGAHDTRVHTRHRYRARELRAKLEQAGLTVGKLSYANTALFPFAALKRLAETRTGAAAEHESDVTETPTPLNLVLQGVLGLEQRALRWTSFPAGLSLVALARKPT